MRSVASSDCCPFAHSPLSLATMRASRELSTPDLQPRPSITGYHGRLSIPIKKTSTGIQSSATWTSNSGDLMSDTDEIANRDDFVDEYNRLAKKVRTLVLRDRFRLTDCVDSMACVNSSPTSPRVLRYVSQCPYKKSAYHSKHFSDVE